MAAAKLASTSSNSGTEVVETAIKLARHATKRPYIVAFLGAFHGRSYGSVSLTASKAKYHAGFRPASSGRLPRPVRASRGSPLVRRRPVRQARPANEVAAIIVDPIQGEGGYVVPEDGFLTVLREICVATASCSSSTRSRRAPGGPDNVGGGAMGRQPRRRAVGEGDCVGDAAGTP